MVVGAGDIDAPPARGRVEGEGLAHHVAGPLVAVAPLRVGAGGRSQLGVAQRIRGPHHDDHVAVGPARDVLAGETEQRIVGPVGTVDVVVRNRVPVRGSGHYGGPTVLRVGDA